MRVAASAGGASTITVADLDRDGLADRQHTVSSPGMTMERVQLSSDTGPGKQMYASISNADSSKGLITKVSPGSGATGEVWNQPTDKVSIGRHIGVPTGRHAERPVGGTVGAGQVIDILA